MFKYYIFFAFHCFTQYYFKIQKYYQSLHIKIKSQTFLCALYKKGEVDEQKSNLFIPYYCFHESITGFFIGGTTLKSGFM